MKLLWAPWRMEYIKSAVEEQPGCIFCEFPKQNNDQANLILYRSKKSFVIMNKFPYNNGHIMVVPFAHIGNILDVDDETFMDIHQTIKKSIQVLNSTLNPHGFNIGMNLGRVAGAGIEDHVHYHIVPRWNGDTNYMPVLSNTKVVSEALNATCKTLSAGFKELFG
ncbi:MAG: HIT domain-containing protein [Calditrichaceae bacterium]|nr:HIT domain-containing protein [Calditrichaceae bacterium]